MQGRGLFFAEKAKKTIPAAGIPIVFGVPAFFVSIFIFFHFFQGTKIRTLQNQPEEKPAIKPIARNGRL
jgi:hypothetical protein